MATETMRALVKRQPAEGIWMERVPVPKAGTNEVLIMVEKTAICGTDLHIYKWDEWSQRTIQPPLVIGHEFVGRIVELGQGVENYNLGDRVSADVFLMTDLRPSLLPGLVDACIYNQRRQQPDVRLFETGAVFASTGERQQVAWVLSGSWEPHWSRPRQGTDFFDASGVADGITAACGLRVRTERADDVPWCVPGRSARLVDAGSAAGSVVGIVGQVRPAVISSRGGGDDVIVAGFLYVEPLLSARALANAAVAPLPRFPSIVRDLSIVVDERLPADAVRGTIRANAPATLEDVREFDRYQGKGVPEGKVSLSVRLTFSSLDRTLTDIEVQSAMMDVLLALQREHGAVQR